MTPQLEANRETIRGLQQASEALQQTLDEMRQKAEESRRRMARAAKTLAVKLFGTIRDRCFAAWRGWYLDMKIESQAAAAAKAAKAASEAAEALQVAAAAEVQGPVDL